jgi:hypothetical protein
MEEKIVVFNKYKDKSAKNHVRARKNEEDHADNCLSISFKLPMNDVILKNTNNRSKLSEVVGSFDIVHLTLDTCFEN